MTDYILTQREAEKLMRLEKYAVDDELIRIPYQSRKIVIPLHCNQPGESFLLDIEKGSRINISRGKLQERVRNIIPLVRIDFGTSAPHRNPDNTEVDSPHLHLYKEGFNDSWAYPLPPDFRSPDDFWATLADFMVYCNIKKPPRIEQWLTP